MSFEEIQIGVPVAGDSLPLQEITGRPPSMRKRKSIALEDRPRFSARPGCCRDEEDNCALLIDHQHPFVRHWETLITIVVTLNGLLVMFMAAFDSTAIALWIIVWLFDVVNLIDVLLTFTKSYTDDKGMSVRDRKLITKRYLKTTFALDFLSTLLILDWLTPMLSLAKPWHTLTALRLNRLIRIYKIFVYFGRCLLYCFN